ncbi:ABC transporter permease [Magnetospirillum molischianum]|uniref:Capsule polysaccharide export inner-membrane protein CtrC n=1 Tax=Magnetospirillum molischianum DSM 120 TaxID=1150626 RepID=H8FX10_MAGML|nr:ABC transporter permease [Magnetospirillum molischianum]CCG42898.1 Capsule polysaccharide export inner-membrane protein CtrC [Magnetospirillum molischianum DSM 120]
MAPVPISLRRAAAIQLRVIGALLLREAITRYGRHNIGLLWMVGEPMLFTLGVAGLWATVKMHTVADIPVIAFAVTGYSCVLGWRNTASRCAKAIEPNLSLMYHRNVKVIDIFMARILLELIGATGSLILLTIFFALVGAMDWPEDIVTVAAGWGLIGWFALALGFIVGSISERSETFERLWHVATYIMFPLSGAMFMAHWLPQSFQKIVLWLPMVHGTEMVRHGYFGKSTITMEDPLYFASINLIMTMVGLVLVRDCEKRVQPE